MRYTSSWLGAGAGLIFVLGIISPRLAFGALGDENWDSRFYFNGADNRIDALTTFGTDLYAGGRFLVIGSVAASGIARWDGTQWLPVGGGIGGYSPGVTALLVTSNGLIVGGTFTRAGTVVATNIARWDGTQWHSLGHLPGGLFDGVNALAELNGQIYAGGSFKQANGAVANYLARWDGSSWITVGTGVNGTVYALYRLGNYVYVGGGFSQAGGLVANGIARFNGINWSPLGSGLSASAQVYAVGARGINLYVGGTFSQAGGLNSPNLAYWFDDGVTAQWNIVGALGATIFGLHGIADKLYVGGRFNSIGGTNAVNIALLDSTGWKAFGSGLTGPGFGPEVSAIEESGGSIFGGGVFQTASGAAIPNIARWDGTRWSNPGPTNGLGFDNTAAAIAFAGTNLYVIGAFNQAGSTPLTRAARWTGNGWAAVGSGLPFTSFQNYYLVADEKNLYAGGASVWRWNGANWTQLSGGAFLAGGGAIALSGTNLYALGFVGSGQGVGRWDGSKWVALGGAFTSEVPGGTPLLALAATGQVVYAAGYFTNASGVAARNVARWDGTQWSAMGTGIPNVPGFAHTVALSISGTNLYAGTINNNGTNVIYGWNGSAWSTFPGVFTTTPPFGGAVWLSSIVPDGTNLYVGGRFNFVNGQSANGIAWWDGAAWHGLGNGLNNVVYATAVQGNKVYAVGDFTVAGGKGSSRFAIWNSGGPGALPPLSVMFTGSIVRLAWPESLSNVTVESTAGLGVPSWLPATGTVRVENGQKIFEAPPVGASSFFRLKSP